MVGYFVTYLKLWITIAVDNPERHFIVLYLSFQYHLIMWKWVDKFILYILITDLRLKMTIMSKIKVSLICLIVVTKDSEEYVTTKMSTYSNLVTTISSTLYR